MEKTKYLRTDFSRLFKKYPLYLAIVGVAVSFIFSLENYAFEKAKIRSALFLPIPGISSKASIAQFMDSVFF